MHVSHITGIINTIPDGSTDGVVRYANGHPALTIGGDLELRREWRQGWMVGAMYSYQRASFLEPPPGEDDSDLRFINAPEHLGSVRGVIPVVEDLLLLGARLSMESQRRIDLNSDDSSSSILLGDVTFSGNVRRFGVPYTIGLYNVGDWRYRVPVTSNFLSRTMVQNGRTVLVDLLLTYP